MLAIVNEKLLTAKNENLITVAEKTLLTISVERVFTLPWEKVLDILPALGLPHSNHGLHYPSTANSSTMQIRNLARRLNRCFPDEISVESD